MIKIDDDKTECRKSSVHAFRKNIKLNVKLELIQFADSVYRIDNMSCLPNSPSNDHKVLWPNQHIKEYGKVKTLFLYLVLPGQLEEYTSVWCSHQRMFLHPPAKPRVIWCAISWFDVSLHTKTPILLRTLNLFSRIFISYNSFLYLMSFSCIRSINFTEAIKCVINSSWNV